MPVLAMAPSSKLLRSIPDFDGPDVLDDPNFTPCRNEKCSIKAVHAAHDGHRRERRRFCPLCHSKLTRDAPRKRAYCPDTSCGWRSVQTTNQDDDEGSEHA